VLEFKLPHAELSDSYRSLVAEFQDAGEPLIPFPLAYSNYDFEAFLNRISADSRGQNLPDGFVPCSTYWLINDGSIVGVANLRHALTDALRRDGGNIGYGIRPSARRRGFGAAILRRTLDRASEMCLQEAWLTCRKANVASVRTILSCGGVFVSEEFLPERGEAIQRYQIRIEPSLGAS